MHPRAPEIRAALETILGSESFSLSDRHRRFLRFIVEETLAGRSDRLKGYTIAVGALGRGEDFDAQNDPYVRVEAGRLRKRLTEYYDAEGADDPVRIELMRGSYAPEFRFLTESPAPRAFGVQLNNKHARPPVWLRAAGGVLLLAAVVVGASYFLQSRPATSPATGTPPSLRVLAFADNSESDFMYFADGLTEEILVQLDRYRRGWGPITVVHDDDLSELDISGQHDYLLSGSVSRAEDSIRVTTRLVNSRSGEQLWTKSFDEQFELRRLLQIQDSIAASITGVIRSPFGPIADAEVELITSLPADQLTPYGCTVLFFDALDKLTARARKSARDCLMRHDQNAALDESGLGALSVLNVLDHWDGIDLLDDETATIAAAYDAAQRALDLEGNTVVAHFAMAFLNMDRQRFAQARASAERILALNPPPSTLGIVAFLLVILGEGETGMDMFDVAITEGARTSPLMYLAPTFFYLERNDIEQALTHAERVDAPELLLSQVLWASLTALAGEMDRSRLYANNIRTMQPDFSDRGREIIGRWSLPTAISDRLIEGLSLAGIDLT